MGVYVSFRVSPLQMPLRVLTLGYRENEVGAPGPSRLLLRKASMSGGRGCLSGSYNTGVAMDEGFRVLAASLRKQPPSPFVLLPPVR